MRTFASKLTIIALSMTVAATPAFAAAKAEKVAVEIAVQVASGVLVEKLTEKPDKPSEPDKSKGLTEKGFKELTEKTTSDVDDAEIE